jgi:hypothetical protein
MNSQKSRIKLFLMMLALAFSLSGASAIAANITSAASGNWSETATWTGSVVPGIGDNVTINHDVTINGNFGCSNLEVTAAQTLDFTPGLLNFSIYGALVVNGAGTFDASGQKTINFYGSTSATGAITTDQSTSFAFGSTGNVNMPTTSGGELNDLTINRSGYTITMAQTLELFGNLTLTAGTLNYAALSLTINGNLSRTAGLFDGTTDGIVKVTGIGVTSPGLSDDYGEFWVLEIDRNETLGGDLELFDDLEVNAGATLTVGANTLTLNGPAFTVASGGTVNSSSTSTLVIGDDNSPAELAFPAEVTTWDGAMTVNRATGMNLDANFTLGGALLLQQGDVGFDTFDFSIAGNLTRVAGKFDGENGKLILTGSGSTTLFSSANYFDDSLDDFELDRNETLIGALTIDGDVTLTSGTLDVATYTLTFDGLNITKASGLIDLTGTGATLDIGNAAGAVDIASAAGTSPFTSGQIYDLDVTSDQIVTLGQDLEITHDFDQSAAGTLDIQGKSITFSGSFTNTAGAIDATDASATVVFSTTAADVVVTGDFTTDTFGTLVIEQNLTVPAITITTALTLTAGIMDPEANQLTLNGTVTRVADGIDGTDPAFVFAIAGSSTADLTLPDAMFVGNVVGRINATRNAEIIMGGDLTLSGTVFILDISASKTWDVNGNILTFDAVVVLTTTTGTIDATGTGSTVVVETALAADIVSADFTSSTIYNLTINANQALTATNTLTVTGTLTLGAADFDLSGASTFNLNGDLVDGGGTITTDAATILSFGGATTTDLVWEANSITCDDITINRTGGSKVTLGANFVLAGDLTLTAGTLSPGAFTLTFDANNTLTKTGGNFATDAGTFLINGALGASTLTLPAGMNFFNLTVSDAAVLVTVTVATGTLTIYNTLTTANADILDCATNTVVLQLNEPCSLDASTGVTKDASTSLILGDGDDGDDWGAITAERLLTFAGPITLDDLTINFASTTGTENVFEVNCGGALLTVDVLTLTAGILDISANTDFLEIDGTLAATTGQIDANADGCIVTLDGTVDAIPSGVFVSDVCDELVITADQVVTLASDLTIGAGTDGVLTLNFTTGTHYLDLGTNTLTAAIASLLTKTSGEIKANTTGCSVVITNGTASGVATAWGLPDIFVDDQVYNLTVTANGLIFGATTLDILNDLDMNGAFDLATAITTLKLHKEPTSWGTIATDASSNLEFLDHATDVAIITIPDAVIAIESLVLNRTAGLSTPTGATLVVDDIITLTKGTLTIPTGQILTFTNNDASATALSATTGLFNTASTSGTFDYNGAALSWPAEITQIWDLDLAGTSAATTMLGDFEILDDLTLGGNTLVIDAFTLTLNKALNDAGNDLVGTAVALSKLTANGSDAGDIIVGTGVTGLHTLVVNRTNAAGEFTIGGAFEVSNTLTMTDGIVDLVTFSMTLTGDNFTVVGGSFAADAAGAGELEISGAGAELTLPAALGTIQTLEIDRANGVKLGGDLVIDGVAAEGGLILTTGNFGIDAYDLTLATDANFANGTNLKSISTSGLIITGNTAADHFNCPTSILELSKLTVNGTANTDQFVMSANGLTVNDEFNLTKGIFTIGANRTITFNGDTFTRTADGSFSANGTVLIGGTGVTALEFPTITTPAGWILYNLTVNRASGIQLGDDLSITDAASLTLTNGDCDLNGDNIITLLGATSTLVESDGNVIKNTDGTGTGYITNIARASTSASEIAGLGVTLTWTVDPGNITIKRYHTDPTPGGEASIKRYYELLQANTNVVTSLKLEYDDTELNSLTEASLVPLSANVTGGPWVYYSSATQGTNEFTMNTVSEFNSATSNTKFWAFGVPTTIAVSDLSKGLAASPLIAGRTDQGVIGFKLSASAATTVTAVTVDFTTIDANQLQNFKLYSSTDEEFSSTSDTQLGSTVATATANQVTFTLASPISLTATTRANLFVGADINTTTTAASTDVTPLLNNYNVVVSTGAVESGSSPSSTTAYAFLPGIWLSQSLVQGLATNPLIANEANKAIMGYTIVATDATADYTGLVVSMTSNPNLVYSGFEVYSSADDEFDVTVDTKVVSTATFSTSDVTIAFTAAEALTTTGTNYFLVATEIDGGVKRSLPTIQASILGNNLASITAGSRYPTNVTRGLEYYFDILKVKANSTGIAPTAGNIAVGGTQQVLYGFEILPQLDAATIEFLGVTTAFDGTSGAIASDYSTFKLYYDANENGFAEFGEYIAAGTKLTGTTSWEVAFGTAPNSLNTYGTAQNLTGGSRRYLVAANVASNAVDGGIITGKIASARNFYFTSPCFVENDEEFSGNARTVKTVGTATKLAVTVTPSPVNPAVSSGAVTMVIERQDANGTSVEGTGTVVFTPAYVNCTDGGAASTSTIPANSSYVVVTGVTLAAAAPTTGTISASIQISDNASTLTTAQSSAITILATEPTVQESAIVINTGAATTTSIKLNGAWTTDGSAAKRILVLRKDQPPTAPTDGIDYVASNVLSIVDPTAGQTAAGSYVVWDKSTAGNNLTISGLQPNTTYYLQAFGYNGANTTTNYITSTAVNNPVSAATSAAAGSGDDGYGTNTSSTSAAAILTDQNVYGYVGLASQEKWFVFNVSSDNPNVLLVLDDLPKNYDIELYRKVSFSTSTLLRESAVSNMGSEIIIINDLDPGAYLLKIYGNTSDDYSTSSTFRLYVQTSRLPYLTVQSDIFDSIGVE